MKDTKKIIIIGAGGHAKSVVDSIEQSGEFSICGYVEKTDCSFSYRGYKVIGTDDDLEEIFESGVKYAAMGIGFMGNSNLRKKLYTHLKNIGYEFPVIVDKSAILAKDVKISEGAFIGKGAIINADSTIGAMAIVNTGSVIEHDCQVGAFSHVAVGTVLCGGVKVGENVLVGANATVLQGIMVEDEGIVGAGAVVIEDVKKSAKVVGVPAKTIG